ncbi:MAG TPA: cupin domain-containing protein, partial [Bryobacteraceae bacterium]|nr:cupin domain-containing protein [Bryobacteraceae bacterium]
MRFLKHVAIFTAVGLGVFTVLRAQQRETLAWAPLPVQPTTWVAPNQPIWRLSELLAKHKGQATWTQTVVDDASLHADYISMGPGVKTPRQFHPDTRAWWIVQDGQIRFSIEGQEPFVASKGYLVQVPYRNVFSMETVGDKPSLRLEVNIGGARTMYPIDEQPAAAKGFTFVKVRISGKGTYDQGNKPYIDFNAVVAGTENQRRFIADDRAVANIIIGDPNKQRPAPDTDWGHVHLESSEFWFILLGKMEYKIGSLPIFVADQGDIVYAPRET